MNEGTIADRMKTLQFEPNGRFEKEAPKADSLHQMLVQALHSGDSSLLESCLQNTDNRVIERTVQRLPSAYIMALVDNLYTRCRTTPGRTYQLSKWLRALLMTHMAYLMTLPNVVEVLAPLYQLLESRVAHHGQLLRLQGRLDVLEKQIRMRSAANNSVEDHSMLESPVVVYDENEEWSENDSLNSDEGLQLVEELDIAAVESSDHDDERN
jgi:U3 small nucleolar RNA-associated protein 5